MAKKIAPPELRDILAELNALYVHDYFNLGLQLGISRDELRYIEANNDKSRRLMEVLYAWEKSIGEDHSCTWEELGMALLRTQTHIKAGTAILENYTSLRVEPRRAIRDRSGGSINTIPSLIPQMPSSSQVVPSSIGYQFPYSLPTSVPLQQPTVLQSYSQNELLFTPLPPPIHPPSPLPPLLPFLPHESDSIPSTGSLPVTNFLTPSSSSSVNVGNSSPVTERVQGGANVHGNLSTKSFHASDQSLHPLTPLPPLCSSPSISSLSSSNASLVIGDVALPPGHPFLPPPPNRAQSDHMVKTVHVARREISRLKQKFAKLSMKVSDLLKEKKIQVSELVRFLRYYSCHDNDFLKDHLPELESKESIDEAVIFLQRFSSFGNPELMQVIVANFIETEAGALMDGYYNELQDFEMSCQCNVYAQAFTAEQYPGQNSFMSYHSHSSNNILLHLNDSWNQRPISDLRSWQIRELQVPNMVLKMERAEKRSILIVWQTTEVVIEKLSKDFVQRFSRLKTQGVLQLIVGGREIDFSYQRTPQIYRIERLKEPTGLIHSVSTYTLQSDISSATDKSSGSKDSGCISENPISVSELTNVPFSAMTQPSTSGPMSTVPRPPEVIIRKRVMPQEIEATPSTKTTPVTTKKEPATPIRPDTPPLEAFVEASKIDLSDNYNKHQPLSPASKETTPLTEENYIKYYYPEVTGQTGGEKSWKENLKKALKSLRTSKNRPSHDTASQHKSISLKMHKTVGGATRRGVTSTTSVEEFLMINLPTQYNSKAEEV